MRTVKTTSDGYLSIANGRVEFLYDADAVAQNIYQALRLFKGEFFLNTSKGIPYKQEIFTKNVSIEYIISIFISAILGINGVLSVEEYEVDYDTTTREFSIYKMKVITQSGTIQLKEVVI